MNIISLNFPLKKVIRNWNVQAICFNRRRNLLIGSADKKGHARVKYRALDILFGKTPFSHDPEKKNLSRLEREFPRKLGTSYNKRCLPSHDQLSRVPREIFR